MLPLITKEKNLYNMSDKITTFPVLEPVETASDGSTFSPQGTGGGDFSSEFTGDIYSSRGRFGNGSAYISIGAEDMHSSNYLSGVAGWKIHYDGNVEINNLTLYGGNISYGKTSFTDSANSGYWISSDGVYFGSVDDATKLKYSITDGTFDLVATIGGTSTIGGRIASTLASAIDASGHFADEAINTATGTILGEFDFGESGALQIGTYSNGVSGDLKLSPAGILARNSAGATTFSIDGTTGVAVLAGLVVGTNVGIGTAVDSAGVTTIIGNTVTTAFVNALNVNAATVSASISITTPTIIGGKTSFTDSTNSGYWISSDGIYLGSASDATYLKYDISSATFDLKATIKRTSDGAVCLDSLGDIINSNLNTSTQKILTDFTFTDTDYAGALKTGTVEWNTTTGRVSGGTGIVINDKGIMGALNGTEKFTLLTDGTATFAGALSAASGTFAGTMAASGITSGTVTSAQIQLNDGGVAPSVIEYDASTKGATLSADTSLTVSHTTTGDNRLLVAGITAHVETVLPAFDAVSKGKTSSIGTSLTVSHTVSGNNRLLVVGITASKPTPAGIVLDATSAGITSSSGATSLTISHTVSGDNRLLVVSVAVGGASSGSSFITGVTYNGVAMTQIAYTYDVDVDGQLSLWYLVAPATGTHDVVITASSSRYIGGEVASYTGVMQTSPLDTYTTKSTNNSTTHTQTLNTDVANELLVASILGGSNATYDDFTDTASQTERQQQNINQANVFYYGQILVDKIISSAGAATSTWTSVSGEDSSIIQAAFKPVDPAVYDPTGVTYNGVAMTKITSQTTVDVLQGSSLWYLIAPATGTHDVVATFAQAHNIGMIAASYENIKQTSPLDDSSEYQVTSTTVSTSLTTTENNELVVAFVGLTDTVANTELTVGSSQTQRDSQDTSDNQGHALADKVATSAGSVTSSWTTTHNEGTLVQASFKKIVDVVADPTGVTYNGVAMTKITSVNSADNLQGNSLWYLIAPATGANNLVATFAANHDIGCIVASYTGIVQTSALDDYSSNSGSFELIAYTNLDTTTYSELVVSFPAWQSNLAAIGTLTEDSSQTKRQTQDTSNGYAHAFGDKTIPNISNVVSGWQTSASANWTITQASFKRIAAVAGEGLTYLACGKWGFNDNDDGFIFGRDAGVTKVIIGNQAEHLSIIGGVVDNTLSISRYTAKNGTVPLILSNTDNRHTHSDSYVKLKQILIGRKGDYKLEWSFYAGTVPTNSGTGSIRLQRRNSATLAYGAEEEKVNTGAIVNDGVGNILDLPELEPYDIISFYAKLTTADPTDIAQAEKFNLYVDHTDAIFEPVYTAY